MTWREVETLERTRAVLLLPVGAIEAHGPHLPLNTDVVLANGMAFSAAKFLEDAGLLPVMLPSIAYSVAHCASGFPGTLSISSPALQQTLEDLVQRLDEQRFESLVVVNSHFDPHHVRVLRELFDDTASWARGIRTVFPDFTRLRLARELTDEFRSGACHAGQYETSLMLQLAPELVRRELMQILPAVPISLVDAFRKGREGFIAAGGEDAYFGGPAGATVAEGRTSLRRIGELIASSVLASLEEKGVDQQQSGRVVTRV